MKKLTKHVVLVACAMLLVAGHCSAATLEWWLSSDTDAGNTIVGNGSFGSPFRVGGHPTASFSKFDSKMNDLVTTILAPGTNVIIHLGSGTYYTRGLASYTDVGMWVGGPSHYDSLKISGAGKFSSEIKLERTSWSGTPSGAAVAVIYPQSDPNDLHADWGGSYTNSICKEFILEDLSINMDGGNIPFTSYTGMKSMPVWVTAIKATVQDVAIVSMFANGAGYAEGAIEAFGILLWTGYWDQNQSGVPINVIDCDIYNSFYDSGQLGYCTGIGVSTWWPGWGDMTTSGSYTTSESLIQARKQRPANHYATYNLAEISGCTGQSLAGHGFGASGTQISLHDNYTDSCRSGFNYDTGWSHTVKLGPNNEFDRCWVKGLNFGASGQGNTNCIIQGNTITVSLSTSAAIGIEVRSSNGITVTNNVVSAASGSSPPSGTTGIAVRTSDGNINKGSLTGNTINYPYSSTVAQ